MSRHLTASLVFHSSRVVVVVGVVVGSVPSVFFLFFFFRHLVSDLVRKKGEEYGASSDNEQAKRGGTRSSTTTGDPPLKLAFLSEHVCTPQGSLTMPLRRLRSFLHPGDLWLKLEHFCACIGDSDPEPSCFAAFRYSK